MTPGTAVLCLGEVMVDVLARLPGPLVTGSDVPAAIALLGGGSAANTACWLGHLGVPTTLLARVGDDSLGERARADIARCGVQTQALVTDADRPTGTCIVLVAPDGERTMVPDAGANLGLCADDLPGEDFVSGRHLHLSAYTLFGAARAAAEAALQLARQRGMTVSVDAASAAPLVRFGAERFLALIGSDVLLLANAGEAAVLTGETDPRRAVALLAARSGRAAVKCGTGGALYGDGASVWHEPAADGPTVIDTTGAGDAFAAGLIALLGRGVEPSQLLAGAQTLARDACTRLGGRPPA